MTAVRSSMDVFDERVVEAAESLTDTERWRAVMSKDPKYRRSFVFGVKSTGTYCRPSCPSRLPKRDQVLYFSTTNEARHSGFRACRRCNPDDEIGFDRIRQIQSVCDYINENPAENLKLSILAERANLSQFHFQRLFKKLIGVTPRQYVESVRLHHLKRSLRRGESVRRSTYNAGYNTSSWLYNEPGSKLGMSPNSYKKGGQNLEITYHIADSKLGRLLAATTGRGLCFISLADSDSELVAHLRDEYPHAQLVGTTEMESGFARWVELILDYLESGSEIKHSNIAVDIRGTAFQRKVWKELQKIPFGTTRPYSEVARRVGCPDGSRAVANACAANPVPLVIPCHRVVRKSGNIGGYALGVERKKKLLENEMKMKEKANPHQG